MIWPLRRLQERAFAAGYEQGASDMVDTRLRTIADDLAHRRLPGRPGRRLRLVQPAGVPAAHLDADTAPGAA